MVIAEGLNLVAVLLDLLDLIDVLDLLDHLDLLLLVQVREYQRVDTKTKWPPSRLIKLLCSYASHRTYTRKF